VQENEGSEQREHIEEQREINEKRGRKGTRGEGDEKRGGGLRIKGEKWS
jgi:hypothetical protein